VRLIGGRGGPGGRGRAGAGDTAAAPAPVSPPGAGADAVGGGPAVGVAPATPGTPPATPGTPPALPTGDGAPPTSRDCVAGAVTDVGGVATTAFDDARRAGAAGVSGVVTVPAVGAIDSGPDAEATGVLVEAAGVSGTAAVVDAGVGVGVASRASAAAGDSPTRVPGAVAGTGGRRVWASDTGRLVTRRPERFTGAGRSVSPGRDGSPLLPTAEASDEITSTADGWGPSGPGPPDLAAAFFATAFLAGFAGSGSSGWTSLRRPSRSALRRARSAWASSIDEEWLLTPIPSDRHRSSASLLVRPSSCASS